MTKRREQLSIGGLTPFSTVDYPGKLAAVVFCRGCSLRCAYCHNAHLQKAACEAGDQAWPEVLEFLRRRRGLLEAVVFSGGEALLQPGLAGAVDDAASSGFAVGLHTAGLSPKNLSGILGNLSWVGFDVKTRFENYDRVGSVNAGHAARASLEALIASGVDHEVRMTVHGPAIGRHAVRWAMDVLPAMGVRRFALQQARQPGSSFGLLDDDGVFDDAGLIGALKSAFQEVIIRRYDFAAVGAERAAA